MKRIALIHTVKSVYESFEPRLREALAMPGLKIHNQLDEFLASDAAPEESGCFTQKNKQRLLHQLQAAALTGADLIVTTCSQLSCTALDLAPIVGTPICTIDGAMIREAVRTGSRLALLSTAAGTVAPVKESIAREAARQQKPVEVRVYCDEAAIQALKRGDRPAHDRLVRQLAGQIQGCDNALLAQASGAHMGPEIAAIAGIPAYTSVELCLQEIAAFFRQG